MAVASDAASASVSDPTADVALVNHLSFGDALNALFEERRVTRSGWNGHGMWLMLVPGSQFTVTAERPLGIAAPEMIGETVTYRSHIDIKTADGELVPWVASQTDLLAGDWIILADT